MDALTSQRIWSVIAMAPTELTKLALSIAHEGTLPMRDGPAAMADAAGEEGWIATGR